MSGVRSWNAILVFGFRPETFCEDRWRILPRFSLLHPSLSVRGLQLSIGNWKLKGANPLQVLAFGK